MCIFLLFIKPILSTRYAPGAMVGVMDTTMKKVDMISWLTKYKSHGRNG